MGPLEQKVNLISTSLLNVRKSMSCKMMHIIWFLRKTRLLENGKWLNKILGKVLSPGITRFSFKFGGKYRNAFS